MIVYHMSQTLKPEDTLTPDFQRVSSFVAPFIQALERSEDCFYAMVLQGKYLYSIFNRSGLRMEWVDYAKWATEAVFEFIRRKAFPDCVGRLECNYFYDNLEDVKALFAYDWAGDVEEAKQVRIYRLELADSHPQYNDMRLFDRAYEAMEKKQDLAEALAYARRYFAGERTEAPVLELLSGKPAAIAEELTEFHRTLMTEYFG